MGGLFGFGWLILIVVNVVAQKKPSINIYSKCLGNIMRLDVGPLGGNLLEVSVLNNSTTVLTQRLASQCGFSVKIDNLGNALIFVSLQNCFADNVNDESFTTTINLRLHGNQMLEDELYQVTKTCPYIAWASREIVCERNYMEVSVKSVSPGRPVPDDVTVGGPKSAAEKRPLDAGFTIKALVFFTPEERMMKVNEARRRGYGISNTPTRLVLRAPLFSPETLIQTVAGVPMTVLKTATIFENKWLATQIDAAAACPLMEGSVSFTPHSISWFLPRRINPLISGGHIKLLEVHMGVDGQRLDVAEMAARRYSMSVNDLYVVTEIPVGAVGGHFKSRVQDGQYFTAYTIEPMLELLWSEDSKKDTRYKVLLPITTPFLPQPPQVIDHTVPEEQIFKVSLGPFCADVALINITFSSEVLSVADCIARGLKIQEHMSPKSCSKVFTLEVPFTDHSVQQMKEMGMSVYSLELTFGLLVMWQFAPFSHTAYLEARFVNNVPPSVSGGCDYKNFYILVKYGTPGFTFKTLVGNRMLTSSLAQQYNFMDNGTHFSFTVPFSAPDVVIEAVEKSSIRSRLDVSLKSPDTNNNIDKFAVACDFFSTLTECFPNGTITTMAMKLESVPSLELSQLTLRDATCGPSYSNDRYAYFVFTGNSCGTTRTFLPTMMLYENEISLPAPAMKSKTETDSEPEYEFKVACYFDIHTNHAVAFNNRPRRSEPYADNGIEELQVEMRLALDDAYTTFYRANYIPMFLRQPLYFEVELINSGKPDLSLELADCWATLADDRTSLPKWDLISHGCANQGDPHKVIFHPVLPDARVQNPLNFKRFEIPMFAFTKDEKNLSRQVFVHCDVVICDVTNPAGPACNVRCSDQDAGMKGQNPDVSEGQSINSLTSGPMLIS
ncbi:uncharacterized protein LOC119195016 [Pungitius pungitius]|uniref:uncharacterized protein LOC119195016 n=1 Tax=Pungitius pungitius TaxID=134920 RepID=UPI002E12AE37